MAVNPPASAGFGGKAGYSQRLASGGLTHSERGRRYAWTKVLPPNPANRWTCG
jgi:hypothetical protein